MVRPTLAEALIEQDADGIITDWNAESERLFGWTRAEAIGMRSERLVPERNRERHRAGLRAIVAERDRPMLQRDVTALHRSGREFPVRLIVSADTHMGATRITAFAREVTRELRADRAAEAFHDSERYRTLVNQIEDGCSAVDLKGNFVFVNDAFCSIFGFDRDAIIGANFRAVMGADRAATLRERYMEVYNTGKPVKAFQHQVSPQNSATRYVEQTISLERDAGGRPVGFLAITRDCTARKLAEIEAAQATAAAEAANRAKSDFLANMSHEIRTPMNGILGMTTLALDTELTPYQRDCLQTVQSQAQSLLTIVNDILDFSKIESRKLEIEHVDFPLAEIVDPVAKLLGTQAAAKGLTFSAAVADEAPAWLSGDPVRVRQVITNLVANAVKFTERGSVRLDVAVEKRTAAAVTLHFTVTDTGIGIPADKHATIFEAFHQADGSMTRRFGGTGLGLAIAAQLVRLMGGWLWLESEPDAGTTFHVTLPFPIASAAQATTPTPVLAPPASRRLSVLVAEDNVVNQRVACGLLTKRGHDVTLVSNGREAVAAVEKDPFDLVLMDVQMPEMNGFEATAAIRAFERTANRRVRVVAMTAHAMAGDRDRCLAAGMDGYIAKPIDPRALFDVVEQPSRELRTGN